MTDPVTGGGALRLIVLTDTLRPALTSAPISSIDGGRPSACIVCGRRCRAGSGAGCEVDSDTGRAWRTLPSGRAVPPPTGLARKLYVGAPSGAGLPNVDSVGRWVADLGRRLGRRGLTATDGVEAVRSGLGGW